MLGGFIFVLNHGQLLHAWWINFVLNCAQEGLYAGEFTFVLSYAQVCKSLVNLPLC